MIHKYIITATDEVKGFDKAIERLDREWGIEELEPCEDCVSRAEAIKEFQIYREYSSNRSNAGWVDRIEAVLKDLPPVTSWSDWIPVSEKLPEPLTAVLLTVRYKSTGQWTYQMGYWEDALEKWEKWLEIGTLDDEFEILAWMELPEGYKEDEHE